MSSIDQLGWNDDLASTWQESEYDQLVPARVIADFGSTYKVAAPDELNAEASGRLVYFSETHEMPKVGDWVAVQLLDNGHGIIHEVLPRKSEISRKQAGENFVKQVLAVNIDIAFLVQALDHDFSPERIQRYLFQLDKEGIRPIIVLNKADKGADVEAKVRELQSLSIPIIVTSAVQNSGIDEIANSIEAGKTAVFLGSSGVGKSTITNQLLGEERQATQAIRETDSKGRHTTTHRELFILPNGGMIVDTPGIRELQLWGAEDDLDKAFDDVESIAKNCQFANCTHNTEPNCAILAALKSGTLEAQRFEAYVKFRKELRYLGTKVDKNTALQRKHHFKKSQKHYNQVKKAKKSR